MVKILLILSVFTNSDGWQPLINQTAPEFPTVAECTAAATRFLENNQHAVGMEVQAIGAECVVGVDDN